MKDSYKIYFNKAAQRGKKHIFWGSLCNIVTIPTVLWFGLFSDPENLVEGVPNIYFCLGSALFPISMMAFLYFTLCKYAFKSGYFSADEQSLAFVYGETKTEFMWSDIRGLTLKLVGASKDNLRPSNLLIEGRDQRLNVPLDLLEEEQVAAMLKDVEQQAASNGTSFVTKEQIITR